MTGICFAHIVNGLPDPFQDALYFISSNKLWTPPLDAVFLSLCHFFSQIKRELVKAPDILPPDEHMLWSAFTLAFYIFLGSISLLLLPPCSVMHTFISAVEIFPSHQMAPYMFTVKGFQDCLMS